MVRTEQPVWSLKQNDVSTRTTQLCAVLFCARKEVKLVNDLAYRMVLQKQIKRKFHGHDKLKSKHVPQYAVSAERQYSQTFVNLTREMEKEVQKSLPKIVRLVEQERNEQARTDSFSDFSGKLKGIVQEIYHTITGKILSIHRVTDLLRKTGLLTEKTVNRQWFQAVKKHSVSISWRTTTAASSMSRFWNSGSARTST